MEAGPAPATGRLGGGFRRLVVSSGLSNLADGVFTVALPLVTLRITRDPGAMGVVAPPASGPRTRRVRARPPTPPPDGAGLHARHASMAPMPSREKWHGSCGSWTAVPPEMQGTMATPRSPERPARIPRSEGGWRRRRWGRMTGTDREEGRAADPVGRVWSQRAMAKHGSRPRGAARSSTVDGPDGDRRRCSRATAQRALRQRFVEARVGRFATRRAAAQALGWSVRKQDALESGDQIVGERDLPAIFAAFGLGEGDDHAAVRTSWQRLAEQSKARGWWDDFTGGDLLPGCEQWVALEWGARRARVFTRTIVPGLLQTAAYTRARLAAGLWAMAEEQLERFVAFQAARQAILEPPDPLECHVIVDEGMLHRSPKPAGLGEQIAHIVDVIDTHPNVTVQVVPYEAGLYPGQNGAFTILDFEGDDGLVSVEVPLGEALLLDDFTSRANYSRTFETLARDVAADPATTRALFERAADRPTPRAATDRANP